MTRRGAASGPGPLGSMTVASSRAGRRSTNVYVNEYANSTTSSFRLNR